MELLSKQLLNIIRASDLMAYVILEPDLIVANISPNLEEILRENDLQAFVGRPLTALFGEFIGAEEGLAAVVAGRKPIYQLENLARKQADDSFIYVTLRVMPLDPADPESGLLLLVENSTEVGRLQQTLTQQRNELKQEIKRRREAESALQQLNDELEQRVKERTAELARANEQLRLLEAAIVNTSDTVIITDAEPKDPTQSGIVYVNNAFTQATGYTYKEIVGQTQQVFHGPNTDPRQLEKIRHALLNREAVHVELVNYRKDGSEFWVDMTVAPITGENHELTHFVSIERDVTERKQLETALLQAQKMEAIGLLAGGIAHDFNNVLTVIISYSDLLLRYLDENDKSRRYVEPIHIAGKRASDLTHQLLAFSRQQALRPEKVNLNEIVTEVENMIRRPIGEDILFTTILAADLWPIQADPGQLSQVIMNLTVNARDAMPHGGMVTIKTENIVLTEKDGRISPELDAGEYVKLTVKDTGKGIDSKTISRIFEPFFTTKESGKGTGLGLSTVYGIVAQSGGGILVHSELDAGSQFEIFLPQVQEAAEKDAAATGIVSSQRCSETILLVEDEASVRQLVQEGLEEQGYQLLVAPNGNEALAICGEYDSEIDLLLTDVVMPGMSGNELAHQLQTIYPNIKVLYMTGYTDTVTSKHGVIYDSDELLQKPFTIGILTGKVHKVLHKSQ
ncbi:MAG: PAS domain-containing protein [Chloroflexi bacterium]|nr:PAS domain-containing protein [Chloroflexota bacterium]